MCHIHNYFKKNFFHSFFFKVFVLSILYLLESKKCEWKSTQPSRWFKFHPKWWNFLKFFVCCLVLHMALLGKKSSVYFWVCVYNVITIKSKNLFLYVCVQHFQVNKVLRNHHIKPHWMFAMDNIIRRAVQAAITILIPGKWVKQLQPSFWHHLVDKYKY